MTPPADGVVASRLRTSRIIHAAMVASLLVYAAIVHVFVEVLRWKGTAASPEVAGVVRWLLYGLGAAEFLGVLVARSRFLSSDALVDIARRSGREAALVQLQTRTLILQAVAESVGIYGLVLFLLTASLQDFYSLWVPSILAQLALAPRSEVWEEVARGAPRP